MSIMPQDESCFADGMIYRVRLTNGWDDFRLISAAFIRIFSSNASKISMESVRAFFFQQPRFHIFRSRMCGIITA